MIKEHLKLILIDFLIESEIAFEYLYDSKPANYVLFLEIELYRDGSKIYFGLYRYEDLEKLTKYFNKVNKALGDVAEIGTITSIKKIPKRYLL